MGASHWFRALPNRSSVQVRCWGFQKEHWASLVNITGIFVCSKRVSGGLRLPFLFFCGVAPLTPLQHVTGNKKHSWVVVSNIFLFSPLPGKWSNLTYRFQMGWNHQLAGILVCSIFVGSLKWLKPLSFPEKQRAIFKRMLIFQTRV